MVGGGIRMGNTYKPMAVLFQCMTKFTTNKIKKKKKQGTNKLPPTGRIWERSKGEKRHHSICPSETGGKGAWHNL